MTKLKLNSKKQTVTATEDLLVNLQHGKSSSLEVNVPKSGNIKIISIVHGKGKESYKLNYKIRHDYPNTYSNSVFKVVLEDQSQFDFEGMIDIENGAENSNAYLKADVLMLSDEARAHVVPSLEIKENDIKASHGATITKINEEQIFYMMSRGLSRTKAKKLIVEGFLNA